MPYSDIVSIVMDMASSEYEEDVITEVWELPDEEDALLTDGEAAEETEETEEVSEEKRSESDEIAEEPE